MAVTKGKVANIKISQGFDFGWFLLDEDAGGAELFIMWNPPFAVFDYIYHSTWVTMLRDALVHDLPVTVGHDEDSAFVTELYIARPTP